MKFPIKSLLVLPLFLFCDKKAPADYAIISGVIKNTDPKLMIKRVDAQMYKDIPVTSDGSFRDTIYTGSGKYGIAFGEAGYFYLYLENGFDIRLELDSDSIRPASKSLTPLKANGNGSQYVQYFLKKEALLDSLGNNFQWPEVYNAPEDSMRGRTKDEFQKKPKNCDMRAILTRKYLPLITDYLPLNYRISTH